MSAVNNLPSVTVGTFTQIVEMQFREKNFRPIFGLGKGGIGKTESIMYLAKNVLKVGYIDIRLLLYGETDLKGIPYPNAEHTKTIWLQNNILPTVERDGEKGILVFDEITSCTKSVRTAAYQLLNERRLGEYVLPDGWLIVCLGNGEEDGGDYNGMEGNFANRCSVYNVVADLDAWKEWAGNNGIHELVIAFVSFKPECLHSYNPNKDTDILFASPRSWKAVSDILNAHGYNKDDFVLHSRITGNVGREVGDTFTAFCKYKDKTVNPMDILTNKICPDIQSREVIYITIQSCVKIMTDKLGADMQMNNISTESIHYVANFMNWMLKKLPLDNCVMGIKDLLRNNKDAVRTIMLNPSSQFNNLCPEWKNFVTNHAGIFL